MTTLPATGRPGSSGPVLAGILSVTDAETVLREAFAAAQSRAVPLRVVAAGLEGETGLSDLVDRWAEKYPDVPVSLSVRDVVDAAITLSAATRGCCLAVLSQPADARAAAVVGAVRRRSACPVTVATALADRRRPDGPVG